MLKQLHLLMSWLCHYLLSQRSFHNFGVQWNLRYLMAIHGLKCYEQDFETYFFLLLNLIPQV